MNTNTDELFSYAVVIWVLAGNISKAVLLPEIIDETSFEDVKTLGIQAIIDER